MTDRPGYRGGIDRPAIDSDYRSKRQSPATRRLCAALSDCAITALARDRWSKFGPRQVGADASGKEKLGQVSHSNWGRGQPPSPHRLKTNSILAGQPAGRFECRRILLSKTNHLHPVRRRCFYLAIQLPCKLGRLRTITPIASNLQCGCNQRCCSAAGKLQPIRQATCRSCAASLLRCCGEARLAAKLTGWSNIPQSRFTIRLCVFRNGCGETCRPLTRRIANALKKRSPR